MYRSILLLAILLSPVFLPGQDRQLDRNYQLTRVSLKEKFNMPAAMLPRLLIQAFCEGDIAGYYPHQPASACSYHEFAAHFNLFQTQPSTDGDGFENVDCPSAFCANKNDWNLEPFCYFYDILEEKGFNTQQSAQKHTIRYIRLIYRYLLGDREMLYMGPVFLYNDVVTLSKSKYSLFNPKNDGAKTGLKQYFESRMFHGYLPDNSGRPRPTENNREKDKWDY